MRKRIYEIIEIAGIEDKASRVYDVVMMFTIILSLIPLTTKRQVGIFNTIDKATLAIFVADYLLRFATADLKLKEGIRSFFRYPFTIMALIDLVSILPSIIILNQGFKVLKAFRLLRTFRVFRVFKAFRYSKNIRLIRNVFRRQKNSLLVVCWLAVAYILISALIVFNVEPDTFSSFFDAIYWATVSLTTVGYGDICATSIEGKFITMVSALFGIAIVALPAGIITAGYMSEVEKEKGERIEDENLHK